MHLSGCIFIVAMTILGAFSLTIKQSTKDRCLEGFQTNGVRIAKCDPNSASQNWIVDGDRIKNEKLQQCISTDQINNGKLVPCEFKPSSSPKTDKDKTNMMKVRIEGNELKNFVNKCLYFGLKYGFFYSCDGGDDLAIVV
jgi:hypothetical protein